VSSKKEEPTMDEQIEELAKLSGIEYDLIRKGCAKELGVRIKTLDAAVSKARGDDGIEGDSQADIAIALFNKSGARLFHDDEGAPFAEVPIDDHMEIWPVESRQFKKWMNFLFWNNQKKALKEQPRKEAIGTLAGLAEIEGDEHKVYLRAAYQDGRHYVDLCDERWRVVEIDISGWRLLDRSPVKFRRTSNMEALPEPVKGGDHSLLWSLVNIREQDQLFILAWIIDSMRENTQCPVLEIVGGHGSAKSTVHKFIRRLIDPNTVDLRTAPKNDDDVMVAARNNRCVSFENMSSASARMQDKLCVIATGGGQAGRELYTNFDETTMRALNPIIINGINPIITAGDLADRAIRIHVPKLDSRKIRQESEISEAYAESQPAIFSGVLDVFVAAIGVIDSVHIVDKPRMLDFSILGEAIGQAIGSEDSFTQSYIAMRESLLIEATQGSPVIMAIVEMITNESTYHGTYKDLLTKLDDDKYRSRGEGWPNSPRGLSGLITRHEPGLSAMGFKISRSEHGKIGNKVKIELLKKSVRAQENKKPRNDVHDVHNVHPGEGGEHGEGEIPKDIFAGARNFSDDPMHEEKF
jgi:hypothetical protein